MKLKTNRTIPDVTDPKALSTHLANITDDLAQVVTGGLTLADNLPFKLYKVQATSGRAVEISGAYACVVFSDSPISKTAWRTVRKGLLSLTLTLDASTASIVVLVINEVI